MHEAAPPFGWVGQKSPPGPGSRGAGCRDDHDRRDPSEGPSHGIQPAGQKGGCKRFIGRTRGGLNSKLHAVADARGRPIGLYPSAGQAGDHEGSGAPGVSAIGRSLACGSRRRCQLVPQRSDRTGYPALHPVPQGPQDRDPPRRRPLPPAPQDREHVRPAERLAQDRHPLRPMCRPLPRGLQLRPQAQDPRRPHAIRIHLQNLDFRTRSIHPKSDPPDAGTEHLEYDDDDAALDRAMGRLDLTRAPDPKPKPTKPADK
jgi:hypothetical protein